MPLADSDVELKHGRKDSSSFGQNLKGNLF
jgi:hypothetical protein